MNEQQQQLAWDLAQLIININEKNRSMDGFVMVGQGYLANLKHIAQHIVDHTKRTQSHD